MWVRAGKGAITSVLASSDRCHCIQLWCNLPASSKMCDQSIQIRNSTELPDAWPAVSEYLHLHKPRADSATNDEAPKYLVMQSLLNEVKPPKVSIRVLCGEVCGVKGVMQRDGELQVVDVWLDGTAATCEGTSVSPPNHSLTFCRQCAVPIPAGHIGCVYPYVGGCAAGRVTVNYFAYAKHTDVYDLNAGTVRATQMLCARDSNSDFCPTGSMDRS